MDWSCQLSIKQTLGGLTETDRSEHQKIIILSEALPACVRPWRKRAKRERYLGRLRSYVCSLLGM